MAKQSKTESRSVGRNVRATVEGDALTLVVDLRKRLGPTGSGKRILVASSGGSVYVSDDVPVKVGLNVTVPLENTDG